MCDKEREREMKMAGRHHPPSSHRFPFLLLTSSLLFLSLLYYIFTSSPALPQTIHAASNPKPDYSFVSSLQKFLANSKSSPSSPVADDTFTRNATESDIKIFADLVSVTHQQRFYDDQNLFYPLSSPIRVYVYNMPSKFTYDLLWLFHNTYKQTTTLTSNGSPVHRLIEQHSIDYWLWTDLVAPESERLLKIVVRVHKQEEADLFYIPFFTTISFFLLEKQQCKALYRVKP